jgi:hypothetical protein
MIHALLTKVRDKHLRSGNHPEFRPGDTIRVHVKIKEGDKERLQEGVLGNRDSALRESFGEDGLLDFPQYTRPAEFRGWRVPEVLLGGNHEEIRKWRQQAALDKTARLRPDLLEELRKQI